MKTYAKYIKFTAVRGKVTAVLIAASLAALSAGSTPGTAEAPPPSPCAAVTYIQKDSQGNRTLYDLSADGTTIMSEKLGPAPAPAACPSGCRPTSGGCVC
jgi:hypothetical protein